MLKRYAQSFYQLGSVLEALQVLLQGAESVLVKASVGQQRDELIKSLFGGYLSSLEVACSELDLRFCGRTVARLEEALKLDKPDIKGLDEIVRDLDRRIRDELTERVLFYVRPEGADHYDNFRQQWEPAISRFNIATDIEEAERCYALGRYSGCVYHLMRACEIGVQELGKYLSLSVPKIQEPWGRILEHVRDEVKKMPHGTQAEKTKQSQVSDAADALWHVNLAWRIPAEHPRTPGDSYNEEQATDALARVKALMRTLVAVTT